MQCDIHVQFGRHIYPGAYAKKVKCIPVFLVALLNVVSLYEAYIQTVVSYLHRGETALLVLRFPSIELFWVCRAILGRLSWKDHSLVTLGKTLPVHCPGFLKDRTLSWYDSFTWKMILKRPLIGVTGEAYIYSLPQSLMRQSFDLIWKMVLKRPFISDTWGWLYSASSGLQGDRALSWYNNFTWKLVLKRLFIGDTGKALACSLFRYLKRQSFDSGWNMVLKMLLVKLGRQSLKSVTLGKALHVYCVGFLKDIALI